MRKILVVIMVLGMMSIASAKNDREVLEINTSGDYYKGTVDLRDFTPVIDVRVSNLGNKALLFEIIEGGEVVDFIGISGVVEIKKIVKAYNPKILLQPSIEIKVVTKEGGDKFFNSKFHCYRITEMDRNFNQTTTNYCNLVNAPTDEYSFFGNTLLYVKYDHLKKILNKIK